MTEPGEPVSRRYRELAREEPPASLDAAILARARTSVGARPRSAARWMGPVSIAAVLVLGIGVSLRMQLEQPGIETSATPPTPSQPQSPAPASPPASQAATQAKPKVPRDAVAAAKPAPAEPAPMKESRMANVAPRPEPKRRDAPPAASVVGRNEAQPAPPAEANPFADAPVAMQQAPSGASTPATSVAAAPRASNEAQPKPAETRAKMSTDLARAPEPPVAPAPPRPASRAAPAPALAGAAPQAKVESSAADNAERELKKSISTEADPDPVRELERIAKLREAGAQREADRALEAFRRRHPDFRIPEAMWERVKPR
jgi:hypothetical protein